MFSHQNMGRNFGPLVQLTHADACWRILTRLGGDHLLYLVGCFASLGHWIPLQWWSPPARSMESETMGNHGKMDGAFLEDNYRGRNGAFAVLLCQMTVKMIEMRCENHDVLGCLTIPEVTLFERHLWSLDEFGGQVTPQLLWDGGLNLEWSAEPADLDARLWPKFTSTFPPHHILFRASYLPCPCVSSTQSSAVSQSPDSLPDSRCQNCQNQNPAQDTITQQAGALRNHQVAGKVVDPESDEPVEGVVARLQGKMARSLGGFVARI